MPQMSPLNWISLNLYFLSSFLILISIINIIPMKSNYNFSKIKNYNKNFKIKFSTKW